MVFLAMREAAYAMTGRTSELMAAEDAGWDELHALMDSLTPEQAERPGYYPEGWTAKDLLAHIGSWLAEAGVILERISVGTYRPEEIDVDSMNRQFLEALKDVPFNIVRAQASSARTRMLQAWRALPEMTPEAAFWIRKSGAEHYAEHLPRLRQWVAELHSGSQTP
jgi:Mycothiol maleylpyruvate isomerase N-terminal domain